MFFCTMAATEPHSMERIEINTITCCHCSIIWANGPTSTRRNRHKAATLGATEKNAVMGVGAPS